MVSVLEFRQFAGQRSDAMIVDIGQVGDAVRVAGLDFAFPGHCLTDEVADPFGAALIPSRMEKGVKRTGQFVFERNRDSLHGDAVPWLS